ncbi:hypothetical protein [Candidatus Palauibacter sp.]|uniref:hypothetical protein n=1 Tax=Candidatus Palauibacter sp. TaxID=3101350 RepID=UPI003B028DC6
MIAAHASIWAPGKSQCLKATLSAAVLVSLIGCHGAFAQGEAGTWEERASDIIAAADRRVEDATTVYWVISQSASTICSDYLYYVRYFASRTTDYKHVIITDFDENTLRSQLRKARIDATVIAVPHVLPSNAMLVVAAGTGMQPLAVRFVAGTDASRHPNRVSEMVANLLGEVAE